MSVRGGDGIYTFVVYVCTRKYGVYVSVCVNVAFLAPAAKSDSILQCYAFTPISHLARLEGANVSDHVVNVLENSLELVERIHLHDLRFLLGRYGEVSAAVRGGVSSGITGCERGYST